jgi:protein-S-isoprenylcysteine O-methyltransferase Ste14
LNWKSIIYQEGSNMVAWINFAILLAASILFLVFYVRSAAPAGREKIIGPKAYQLCFYDRLVSGVLEFVITANYILYFFFPLDTPLPVRFPWMWWISLVAALIIGVPATTLMVTGIRDAGEETMRPKKEHALYGGIYTRLRHPQATGEVFLFLVIAFLLNSPFLAVFSLIYFPMFIVLCYAEEQDLLLRYGDAYAEYCRHTGAFWPKRGSSR